MTKPEPQFIVRTQNGRKSKAATREAIQRMFADGKIPESSVVTIPGREFSLQIEKFVNDSAFIESLVAALPVPLGSVSETPEFSFPETFVPASCESEKESETPVGSPAFVVPASKLVRRNRRSSPLAVTFVAAGLFFLVSLVVFLGPFSPWRHGDKAENLNGMNLVPAFLQGDEVKTAVRAYLKESLPSGEWDEVKWYPNVKITNQKQEDILSNMEIRMDMQGRYSESEFIKVHMALNRFLGPDHLLSMVRIRTKNLLGAMQVSDIAFQIVDGKAYMVDQKIQEVVMASWDSLHQAQ